MDDGWEEKEKNERELDSSRNNTAGFKYAN